jgi:hypothetical protein
MQKKVGNEFLELLLKCKYSPFPDELLTAYRYTVGEMTVFAPD